MLEIKNLTKSYGDILALDRFSLDLKKGDVLGLLGPNGAGKTTLISILSGTLGDFTGTVNFQGRNLFADREIKNRLGIVPQDMAFYDELSAMDNLLFWGGLYDVPRADLKKRAAELLELVELAARAKEPVKNFSGGMKRRLNTAIGLLHRPDLLLLDEPTVGIDVQAKVSILEIIRDIGAAGTAVIFTTHQLAEVETTCSRIAIMDRGRILAQGTLDELVRIVGERDIVEITGRVRRGRLLRGRSRPGGGAGRAPLGGRRPGLAGRVRHGRDPTDHGPPLPEEARRHRHEDQVAQPGDGLPEAHRAQPKGLRNGHETASPHPRERRAPAPQVAGGHPHLHRHPHGHDRPHRHHLRPPDGGDGAAVDPAAPRRPRQGAGLEAPARELRRRSDEEDVPGDGDGRSRGPQTDGEGQGLGHGRHPGEVHPRPARGQDDDPDRGQEPGRAVPARHRRRVHEHDGRHALRGRPGLRRRGPGHPGHARRPHRELPLGQARAGAGQGPEEDGRRRKRSSIPCSCA